LRFFKISPLGLGNQVITRFITISSMGAPDKTVRRETRVTKVPLSGLRKFVAGLIMRTRISPVILDVQSN
jgi:hypothetical protein